MAKTDKEIEAAAKEITRLQFELTSMSERYQAKLQLFTVAARFNDGREMDRLRTEIHIELDMIMDGNARLGSIMNEFSFGA